MASQCLHFSEQWTLRQLLDHYEGALYHQWIGHAAASATAYNAQRAKRSDRVWSWQDLHPWHAQRTVGRSGREVLAAMAAAMSGETKWAEGFSPEMIGGNIASN